MRSTHAPKACITGGACITHEVRIMFRKERITQKNPFVIRQKGFLMAGGEGFEPSQTESESGVLPLHKPPKCLSAERIYNYMQKFKNVKYFFEIF